MRPPGWRSRTSAPTSGASRGRSALLELDLHLLRATARPADHCEYAGVAALHALHRLAVPRQGAAHRAVAHRDDQHLLDTGALGAGSFRGGGGERPPAGVRGQQRGGVRASGPDPADGADSRSRSTPRLCDRHRRVSCLVPAHRVTLKQIVFNTDSLPSRPRAVRPIFRLAPARRRLRSAAKRAVRRTSTDVVHHARFLVNDLPRRRSPVPAPPPGSPGHPSARPACLKPSSPPSARQIFRMVRARPDSFSSLPGPPPVWPPRRSREL